MLKLDPRPSVITFDCYGTLVQWHQAVRNAACAILARRLPGDEADAGATGFADTLRATAVARQERSPFVDYETVLRESLAAVLAQSGHTAGPEDVGLLLSTLGRIEPHPEVPTALARLRTRYRLAIISNTSDALIARTVAALGTPIDFVVTAQQARAYKPDHALFCHAYAAMGVTPEQTVHVGMGQFTDLKVCHEMGIRSVWIDRIGEPLNPNWPPHATLPDLVGLPALLLAT